MHNVPLPLVEQALQGDLEANLQLSDILEENGLKRTPKAILESFVLKTAEIIVNIINNTSFSHPTDDDALKNLHIENTELKIKEIFDQEIANNDELMQACLDFASIKDMVLSCDKDVCLAEIWQKPTTLAELCATTFAFKVIRVVNKKIPIFDGILE